jgi:hypothetical protein
VVPRESDVHRDDASRGRVALARAPLSALAFVLALALVFVLALAQALARAETKTPRSPAAFSSGPSVGRGLGCAARTPRADQGSGSLPSATPSNSAVDR